MPDDPNSIEERKKKLIAQGGAFRAQVIDAKQDVHAGLRPDSLLKGTFSHIAATLRNRHVVQIAGANLSTVLPLLVSGISALSKGSLKKPVMRAVVIAGVAGAIATLLIAKKKAQGKASRS
jgi:hypothetical protein